MVSSHSDFTEVTRVELIHQYSVMVLTTCITASSRMAPVFTDTTVTSADMSSLLTVVMQSGRLMIVGQQWRQYATKSGYCNQC